MTPYSTDSQLRQTAQPSQFKLVSALGVTQILAWGSTYYLPAVLAAVIAKETHWALASVIGGLSWGLLVAGLSSPLVGRRIDTQGGRYVLASSSLLLALGLVVLALAPNLPAYYFAWTILGLGMGAGLYDAAFATLGTRFGSNARSAIAGLTLFAGFASTLAWPTVTALEQGFGWRHACGVLAAMHLLIGLPIHLLVVPRGSPQPRTLSAQPSDARFRPGASAGMFLVATLFTAHALVVSSLLVHLLDLLKQLGIAAAVALSIGMVFGPSQVAARLLDFWGGSRIHPIYSTRLGLALCSIGVSLLLLGKPVLAFVAVVLYGAGNGILTIARGTLPLALFGADNYGARMGWLARPLLVAQAAAPLCVAVALQHFGSQVTLIVLTTISFCGLIGTGLLSPRTG